MRTVLVGSYVRWPLACLLAASLQADNVNSSVPPPKVSEFMTGQIVVDLDHPEWFKYHGGGPMFMCGPGDPENFLYRGTRNADGTRSGDQMTLIDKLKGTGANCVYLQIIRSHGGDGDPDHNPFNDYTDPSSGLDTDILDQWETWFTELDNDGINIFLFFYDDAINVSNNLGWPMNGGELHADEETFIKGIVNSFEHHTHLIWCVMEEVAEMGSDYLAHASKIAETIKEADDHDHPVSCHQNNGLVCAFPDDPNMDQFAIQYNVGSATNLHNGMVTAWNNSAGRYNLNMAEASGHYYPGSTSRTDLRKKNWAIAMGGAYVMVYRMDIAGTPVEVLEDCGRLVEFFEMTDFNVMAPHDDLAYGGTDYVLALAGESYIAYASDLYGDIGLKNMTAGTYRFTWYDCETGIKTMENDVSLSAGDQVWTKPGTIGNELAVWITNNATGLVLKARVFLEGSYNSGSMSTDLGTDIPLSHPYEGAPWNHSGSESVTEIPAGVVDWVLVELRTGTESSTKTTSRAAFLKSDGSIVDTDGSSEVVFSGASADYYVVVYHRNHVTVMSASPLSLSSATTTYDFTTGTDKYYGGDAKCLGIDPDYVYAMYTGDANGNGQVQNDDKNDFWKVQVGTSGYKSADFNLNGEVQNDDKNDYWKNNVGKGTICDMETRIDTPEL